MKVFSLRLLMMLPLVLMPIAVPTALVLRSMPAHAQTNTDARRSEAIELNNQGQQLSVAGGYAEALEHYERALTIVREINEQQGESTILNNIGAVYDNLGNYLQALSYYEQALTIAQELGNRSGEGITLNNIGGVYNNLSNYSQALSYYEQALTIAQEIDDRSEEGTTLNNIGLVYDNMGNYQQALSYYEQALAIAQEIGHRAVEGTTLNNIGGVYRDLGNYSQALSYYEQARAIAQEIGHRAVEGTTLNNIGGVYRDLGNYQQALSYYEQALTIAQEIGDRAGEGTTLNNIGGVYDNLGNYQQALSYYEQALAIRTEVGDRAGAALTLNNIGVLLETLDEPELAIILLKQSVNVYETIRGDIQGLDTELQQSFTDSISGSYRHLADLLLAADRVLEAQRVLDLLRVQELDEYLQDVQRSDNSEEGIANRPPEQIIQDNYGDLLNRSITIHQELRTLEAQDTLSDSELDQLIALGQEAEQLIQAMNTFWDSPEVQAQVALLRQTTDGESIDLSNYRDLQASLAALDQNAVLLYPFILDDRLELVLVTPDAETPLRATVQVDRVTLNGAIANYRSALEDPTSDPLPLAQQLYDWLLAPLADDLTVLQTETIIYAPDGQLRYIPLSALHDGNQWTAQQFRINNITAASLMDITQLPPSVPNIFAAAFTEGTYTVPMGDRQLVFTGLEFAGREVENIASLIPGTVTRFNDDFTTDTTYLMNRHNIVHIATHASFVPGRAEESFILFGDGSTVSLRDVSSWRLPDVDLVVLSACETGVGDELGDGREILGLGYQMQKAGASAAIASLWAVSDGGTQTLMDAFYANLNQQMTKAEALLQAQIALITSDLTASGVERGASVEVISTRTGLPLSVANSLSHPYYWAPFILIGNGL